MAQTLKLFDVEVTTGNAITHDNKFPLTVGTSFQPNDLRVCWVYAVITGSTGAPVNPFGSITSGFGNTVLGTWTNRYTASGTDLGRAVYTSKLIAGQQDARVGISTTDTYGSVVYAACTIRNWDPTQTITVGVTETKVSNAATYTVNASSVTVTAGGILLIAYTAGLDGYKTIPTGMTDLGDGGNQGAAYNLSPEAAPAYGPAIVLCGQAYNTSGSSGTKSLTGVHDTTLDPVGSPPWSFAYSVFIKQAPDISVTIGAASEVDTAGAVTAAPSSTTTTVTIGAATENDTAGEIHNPLWGQHTHDPLLLNGDPVLNSRIEWTSVLPAPGASVVVETSIDYGATWQVATSGKPIPLLDEGNTTVTVVLYRETVHRALATDASPSAGVIEVEIALDSSEVELVSLGVFSLTETDIGECGGDSSSSNNSGSSNSGNGVSGAGGTATGGGRSITLTATDRSYRVSRQPWLDFYFIEAGTNYMDAFAEILQNRYPGCPMNLGTTTRVTEETLIFGGHQENDPWLDLRELMRAIGFVAYFDSYGVATTRPIPNATIDSSVWTFSDGSDGANPTISELAKTFTPDSTYNYVVVTAESTGNATPIMAVAFDNDPHSDTYYLGKFGIVPAYYTSPNIFSQAQAQEVADALLLAAKGAATTLTLSVVPMPALCEFDVFTAIRPESGINDNFMLNGASIPMGPSGAMTITGYRQNSA